MYTRGGDLNQPILCEYPNSFEEFDPIRILNPKLQLLKYRCSSDAHHLEYLPKVTILGSKEDPGFAFLLSVALRFIVFDNPFNGLTDQTRATSDKNDRRHDVMNI